MAGRLANKVCIVTGAASGQGRVGAQFFAREGAKLLLADVDKDGLEEVDRLIRDEGFEGTTLHVGDLTQESTLSTTRPGSFASARLTRRAWKIGDSPSTMS
jgi:NAD(P)-dependent dehydrogenase (short-subunit alcohol dehydrogenase family)